MKATSRFSTDSHVAGIYERFIALTLPKQDWTHAAHFAAALFMLKHTNKDPFISLPEFIRKYNESTGVENTDTSGYHHSITMASLLAAKHIIAEAPQDMPLYDVANRLLESKYGRSAWVLDYWTKPVLFSSKARRDWVGPDRQPLPFPICDLAGPKNR